jgi:hypothetical protein
MNEHIDILLLLDYAQGKISDDSLREPITDHLCECENCRQILKSHYYLIQNHEVLLEKFFPEVDYKAQYVTTAQTNSQTEFLLSVTSFTKSVSDKIKELQKQGSFIGQEIKGEVLRFMDEIRSFSYLEESLVPLKVENISLLGADEVRKSKDQELRYLSHDIKLSFLPFEHFTIEDFSYRFTGKFFYISYEVSLTTDIGPPFIFTTTFKEAHKSVSARFKLEFEDISPVNDIKAKEESYRDFFLSIE